MNDRFKFRIAVYERQQNNMPWEFVEYKDPDNQHWGLNQCGDIISDSSYSAHYTRKNAPDSVHRVYEPEQCTGLKDKNGNLIYEGDIVKCGNATGIVCFGFYRRADEHFPDSIYGYYIEWKQSDFRQDFGYWATEERIEIIGNIHKQAEQKD